MKKSDLEKFKLDFAKNAIQTLFVALFGIVSYTFINYEKLNNIRLGFITTAIFALVILLCFIGFVLFRFISRLQKGVTDD